MSNYKYYLNMRCIIKWVVIICFFLIGTNVIAQPTQAILDQFLGSANLRHAKISLEIKNISSGKILISHNENISLTPASVNKIITTATALDFLGSDYIYETPLWYDGTIKDSILTGNIYIEGVGDPTMGSEYIGKDQEAFLNDLSQAIKRSGIKSILGDVVIIDDLFGYEGVSPKWPWEDLGNYYAPGIYGISIFDNMTRIYLQSKTTDTPVTILYTKPIIPDLELTNHLKSATSNNDNAMVSGIPFSNERYLVGTIPVNRSSFVLKGDIPDPGMLLATYFRSFLIDKGIKVSGKATTSRIKNVQKGERNLIIKIQSPDLFSIVKVINFRSNNHYAEHIYKLLTIKHGIDINSYWKKKGLDASTLFMYDGSGLSPSDAVSANFINNILEYMYKKDGKEGSFYKTLPLVGKEGTVASFLKKTKLEGKAHLKSGSIANVHSYAGYVHSGNQDYVFSLLVNNFNGSRLQLKREMEKLLISLF